MAKGERGSSNAAKAQNQQEPGGKRVKRKPHHPPGRAKGQGERGGCCDQPDNTAQRKYQRRQGRAGIKQPDAKRRPRQQGRRQRQQRKRPQIEGEDHLHDSQLLLAMRTSLSP